MSTNVNTKQPVAKTGKKGNKRRQAQQAGRKARAAKPKQRQVGHIPKNDSRLTTASVSSIVASGVAPAVNQLYNVNTTTLWGASYQYICMAIQRGWLANAPTPAYPFAAWQYMCTLWASFINGTIPAGSKLPYWIWALGRAITPKTAGLGMGSIYYKALIASGSMPSEALYSVGAYSYQSNLYVPGTTNTDLFPNAVAPSTLPTPELAFLSLCGFMADSDKNMKKKNGEMFDEKVVTIFDKDVSAFCDQVETTGYGDLVHGGLSYLATLEVPIHTPLLSPSLPAVAEGETGAPTRSGNWATQFAGDEMSMSALLNILPISKWKTKISPKFKFIDFLQVGDVVAKWISKAVTKYYQDPALAMASSFDTPQVPSLGVCPITLQEMLILLRNEILFNFGHWQNGVMALQPILPTSNADNQFQALLTGSTGSALQTFGMLLPSMLVENLKALFAREVPSLSGRDCEVLYPVWGKYILDQLSTTDYEFMTQDATGNPIITSVFTAVPPMLSKRKSSKAGTADVWEKLSVETPIDLIDTSNGSTYVFINDPGRLKTLCTLWNEYVKNFAPYSSPLTPFAIDPGVNVLNSINQTRYWAPASVSERLRNADSRDLRVESRRGLSAGPYAVREAYAISYREKPFQQTATITANWILPISHIQLGASSENTTPFVKVQAFYKEPFAQTTSTTGDAGMSLAALNDDYANMMVHGKNEKSVFDEELLNLTRKGDAGILSSLAASFIGSTFGSTAGSIASSVADILPF